MPDVTREEFRSLERRSDSVEGRVGRAESEIARHVGECEQIRKSQEAQHDSARRRLGELERSVAATGTLVQTSVAKIERELAGMLGEVRGRHRMLVLIVTILTAASVVSQLVRAWS